MHVENLAMAATPDGARLSADLVMSSGQRDTVYFEVPGTGREHLNLSTLPFLIAGLPVASQSGETISWNAPIPFRLRRNIKEFVAAYRCWFPSVFAGCQVAFVESTAFPAPRRGRRGVFFSGGIDALHTAFRVHTDPVYSRPDDSITLIHISDGHQDAAVWRSVMSAAERVAEEFGWDVLPIRTNVRSILGPERGFWPQLHTHGIALISVAYALSAGFDAVHIGSATRYDNLPPDGSTPRTDELWTSEDFQVLHVGADCSRMDKMREMSAWPTWQGIFRVCFSETTPTNCGKCGKCVRTIFCLDALGQLETAAGAFVADPRGKLVSLVPGLWTKNPGFVVLLDELIDAYRSRDDRRDVRSEIEKLRRHLRPSPVRAFLRSADDRFLRGTLNRLHSRLRGR